METTICTWDWSLQNLQQNSTNFFVVTFNWPLALQNWFHKILRVMNVTIFERELAALAAVQVESLGKPEEAEGTIYKSLDSQS